MNPPSRYRFTRQEHHKLQQAGCHIDPESQRVVRLARRGFSKAEIIQACRDVRRYAGIQHYRVTMGGCS